MAAPPPPCRFYALGSCIFGSNCRNRHVETKNEVLSDAPTQNQRTPVGFVVVQTSTNTPGYVLKKNAPCFAWEKGGCERGDKCWYVHDPAKKGIFKNSPPASEADTSEIGNLSPIVPLPPLFPMSIEEESWREVERLKEMLRLDVERVRAAEEEKARKAEEKKKRREAAADRRRAEAEQKAREEEEQRKEAERLKEEWRKELLLLQEKWRKEEEQRKEEQRRKDEERRRKEEERRHQEEERRRKEEEKRRRGEEKRRREEERRRKEEEQRTREEAQRIRSEETAKREAAMILKLVVQGSIVSFSAGLDIRGLITGFEACRITVKNLPGDTRKPEIGALFAQQGLDETGFHVVSLKKVANCKLEATIVTDAQSGAAIAAGLDEIPFKNEILTFDVGVFNGMGSMGASEARDVDVLELSFRAPSIRYVVELPEETIQDKIKELNGRTCSQRQVKVERNTLPTGKSIASFRSNSIHISNLPVDVTDAAVAEFAGTAQGCVRKLNSAGAYTDLDSALSSLRDLVSGHVPGKLITFDTKTRGDKNGVASIRARFSDHDAARKVYDTLHGKRLDCIRMVPWLHIKDPFLYTITISREQYQAQRTQWDELRDSITDKAACDLKIQDQDSKVRIQVVGNVKAATGALKVRVEDLAAGERVEGWHPSLSRPDDSFIQRIKESGAYFRSDSRRQTLTLYGKSREVAVARQIIVEELERLSNLEWKVDIPQSSIQFFVRQGLSTLQEIFGQSQFQLDTTTHQLTVRGPEEARYHVTRLIEESKRVHSRAKPRSTGSATCPVCTDTPSAPYKLGCGHEYCTACLCHLLTAAVDTKIFPLVCVANDSTCGVPISIPLVQRFLPRATFDVLLEEVFNTFLNKHPMEYKNCRTPTCTQIYRTSAEATVVQCPSCFVELCSACGLDGHKGLTCAEYKVQHDPKEQERVSEQWISKQTHLRKCPRCSRLLEKNGGCNHITCPCGAHICWRCMGVYSDGEIYPHLNTAHGGYYTEGDPPAAVAAPDGEEEPAAVPEPPQYDPFLGADYQEQLHLLQEAGAG